MSSSRWETWQAIYHANSIQMIITVNLWCIYKYIKCGVLCFAVGQFSPWQSQKSCTGVWFVIEVTHRLVLVWRDEGEEGEAVRNVLGRCALKEILLDWSGRSKSITVQEKSRSSLSPSCLLPLCLDALHICGGGGGGQNVQRLSSQPISARTAPLDEMFVLLWLLQALLCRLDHYAWLVFTEILRQEAQRCYRLLCLHPSACLCVTCKHTHLLE